ncbi:MULTISPECIES: phosphopantetheine-binding protein [Kitasatospora]|uniref:Carrier domain-containing protein n=1 Tax=Kitasatospora setae (strain ATCC 33774 / DSM 43861 / JCM 3304 / KCC A-0304 / NBRC 14216 / KM-6054) TaxID=452652 RepID=E4N2G3_KITSK|nr:MULTISPECIES: phosphopantetheine-binding protein [Kitasatospora]BAJ32347.1 hypothetical protein KSE_65880 [Kitasatospora setae KM-6054]
MTTSTDLSHDRIKAVVVAALADVLDEPLADTGDDIRLFDDLNLDSTSVLGLLMNLEDSLRMEVDPDSLEQDHLATIGSLTEFVAATLRNG